MLSTGDWNAVGKLWSTVGAQFIAPLLLFFNNLDEDDGQFKEAGHGDAQENGAVDVCSRSQEGRGDPHTDVGGGSFPDERS